MSQQRVKAHSAPAKVAAVRSRLETALFAAREAGIEAGLAFSSGMARSSDGHVADSCGWAYVDVSGPNYHFREALKLIKPGTRGFRGSWTVVMFHGAELGKGASKSITAHEKACQAARDVLEAHFPDLQFYVRSRLD